MNLQQAIRAAGEGGRIKRPCWVVLWLKNEDGDLAYDGDLIHLSVEAILAEDWEVVTGEKTK